MRRLQLQQAAEYLELLEYEKAREVHPPARPGHVRSSPSARAAEPPSRRAAEPWSSACVALHPYRWQLLGAIEADLRGINVPGKGRVGPKDPHSSTFQVGHIEC